jgi:hypothetical protein
VYRCALMCEAFVFKWWDALDAGSLKDCYDWSQVFAPNPTHLRLVVPAIMALVLYEFVTILPRFID